MVFSKLAGVSGVFQFFTVCPCSKMGLFDFIVLGCIVFQPKYAEISASSTNKFSSVETLGW